MNSTVREGPHLGTDEQGASRMKRTFPIAVRVADMPDDLGKLLGMGIEEYVRGR